MWPCPVASSELLGEVYTVSCQRMLPGFRQEVRILSGNEPCTQSLQLSRLTGLWGRPSFNFLVELFVFSLPIPLPPESILSIACWIIIWALQALICSFDSLHRCTMPATNLCVSRISRNPSLFEARGNRCFAVSPGKSDAVASLSLSGDYDETRGCQALLLKDPNL